MNSIKNIFLLGFMGCGKSTTGEKLANLLECSFIDLDKKIEELTGKTISDIFSQEGEDYFRKTETEVLLSIRSHKNVIVATGGGTPCYNDNMDMMLETGITIYLKLTPLQLLNRLSGSDERPLIKGMNDDQLLSFIEEKLKYRENWYNRSEIIIAGTDPDLNSLAEKLRNL
jgi:shikimate kinase